MPVPPEEEKNVANTTDLAIAKTAPILSEFYETEKKYLDDLDKMSQLETGLMKMVSGSQSLSVEDKKIMKDFFSNIRQITQINREIGNHAETLAQKKGVMDEEAIETLNKLNDIFSVSAVLHANYLAQYNQLMKVTTKLNSVKANRKMSIMQEFDKVIGRNYNGLQFNQIISKPMQRFTKYPLLLRDLVSKIPETHPASQTAKNLHENLVDLAKRMNEKQRASEQSQAMQSYEMSKQNNISLQPLTIKLATRGDARVLMDHVSQSLSYSSYKLRPSDSMKGVQHHFNPQEGITIKGSDGGTINITMDKNDNSNPLTIRTTGPLSYLLWSIKFGHNLREFYPTTASRAAGVR